MTQLIYFVILDIVICYFKHNTVTSNEYQVNSGGVVVNAGGLNVTSTGAYISSTSMNNPTLKLDSISSGFTFPNTLLISTKAKTFYKNRLLLAQNKGSAKFTIRDSGRVDIFSGGLSITAVCLCQIIINMFAHTYIQYTCSFNIQNGPQPSTRLNY